MGVRGEGVWERVGREYGSERGGSMGVSGEGSNGVRGEGVWE